MKSKIEADSQSIEEQGQSDSLYYRALVWAENAVEGASSSKGRREYTLLQQLYIWFILFVFLVVQLIYLRVAFLSPFFAFMIIAVAFSIPWALALWTELTDGW